MLGDARPINAKPGDSGVEIDLFGFGDVMGVRGGVIAFADDMLLVPNPPDALTYAKHAQEQDQGIMTTSPEIQHWRPLSLHCPFLEWQITKNKMLHVIQFAKREPVFAGTVKNSS